MDQPFKKRFFAKHAKSSAALVSLVIHAVLVIVAFTYVAVKVIEKPDQKFEDKRVARPKMELKKLQVPVKLERKKKPAPKLRQTLVAKVDRKIPEFRMPEIAGVKGGLGGGMDAAGVDMAIGLELPEINFFGAKAKGDRVVFIVHFGPATIGKNPFTRLTGYTIRKRLGDMVANMPEYTLFNVACYWKDDADALSDTMLQATKDNKQKVLDWMAPVNPLEGDYSHCFEWGDAVETIDAAKSRYPTLIDKGLPFYSPKWVYPYEVPSEINQKYAPNTEGFVHWTRALVWALQTQHPDTIFILTTNYIDAYGGNANGDPGKTAGEFADMLRDLYGPDRSTYPTLNIVVLAPAGHDSSGASTVLNQMFGPTMKRFKGNGSVIEDITKYMTASEKELYEQYRQQYASKDRR